MKNNFGKNCACFAVFLVLLGALVFCACNGEVIGNDAKNQPAADGKSMKDSASTSEESSGRPEYGKFEGLSVDTEMQILKDYYKTYIEEEFPSADAEDFYISGYYGTYDGWSAVTVLGPYAAADLSPNNNGMKFTIYNAGVVYFCHEGPMAVVWKDSRFVPVSKIFIRYDLDTPPILSVNQVKTIAMLINRPLEGPDAETASRVQQDYADLWNLINSTSWYQTSYTKDDIQIFHYWGTYNGAVAVSTPFFPATANMNAFTVGGVYFCDSNPPTVWKDGYIYGVIKYNYDGKEYTEYNKNAGLKEAYNSGVLTSEDLQKIADLMQSNFGPFWPNNY